MKKIEITTEYLERVFPAFCQLSSLEEKRQITKVYQDMFERCGWSSIEDACFSPALPDCRLVDHINAVMEGTLAAARCMERYQGIEFDYDNIIVLAMLHDVSKLVEYEPAERYHSLMMLTKGANSLELGSALSILLPMAMKRTPNFLKRTSV